MGTADIIGFTYLGIAATCLIIGAMIGAWRAITLWGDNAKYTTSNEQAFERVAGYSLAGMGVGVAWPLAIPMLIVAGPAWHVRNKRQQAETERKNTASALREAANLYKRGSEEWYMLRKVADETMAGKN